MEILNFPWIAAFPSENSSHAPWKTCSFLAWGQDFPTSRHPTDLTHRNGQSG
jgi:hypothetical protein